MELVLCVCFSVGCVELVLCVLVCWLCGVSVVWYVAWMIYGIDADAVLLVLLVLML